MNLERVEAIVRAVLYEGYILYPYRPSAVKNRQRFNFGVLAPEAASGARTGAESWLMKTECLAEGSGRSGLEVRIRFLHLVSREVGRLRAAPESPADPEFDLVESLQVDDRVFRPWQEAVERDVRIPQRSLEELVARPAHLSFLFPSTDEVEPIRSSKGEAIGILRSRQERIEGSVEIMAEAAGEGLFRLRVSISNQTPVPEVGRIDREGVLTRSFVSTHTILGIHDGALLSLTDPPPSAREAAAGCRNVGTWPVLIGEEGEHDLALSSPIILYDYPRIAAESAGDLFDGTEIDEILTLRILTLTDEEKREMRGTDARAREILERTETLPKEQWMKLHGALRGRWPMAKEKGEAP
jgi:hydrogenase maturation protease